MAEIIAAMLGALLIAIRYQLKSGRTDIPFATLIVFSSGTMGFVVAIVIGFFQPLSWKEVERLNLEPLQTSIYLQSGYDNGEFVIFYNYLDQDKPNQGSVSFYDQRVSVKEDESETPHLRIFELTPTLPWFSSLFTVNMKSGKGLEFHIPKNSSKITLPPPSELE